MRFGLVHRIMTDALATLGVLAVVNTAAMPPWTTGTLLVGLVVALAIPETWQNKPALRHFATIGPLALFAVQGARLMAGRSMLDIAIEFAALLQIVRLATRRGAAHDQQIIVLALLHFVAGTVLGGGLSYGLCFLGFLVVAPGALVLSHLRREVEGNYRQGARDRTGLPVDVPRILRSRRVVGKNFLFATCLLSFPIFVFTATLFLLFPRVGLSLLLLSHPRNTRMVGFSDHVDLGEVGQIRTDPSLALRFDVANLADPPPPTLTLRLRGTAFDAYDGRAWKRTVKDRPTTAADGSNAIKLVRRHDERVDRKVSIDLEPIDPPVVFFPPRTVSLLLRQQQEALLAEPVGMVRGPEGEVRYVGETSHGLRYDAWVSGDREPFVAPLHPGDRVRYLDLPAEMPARIRALAHTWADDQPTPYAKAKAIEEHLKQEFTYDMGSPSGGTPQPVDHFLFESKRGHCEFFSTSMALMLREVGIPSRNVTGFVGGTYNRFGRYYAVRQGDAHSWVEAYLDDPVFGWVTFDPTPTSGARPLHETTGAWVYMRDLVEALTQRWNRYVVGYDLKTQVRIFEDLTNRYDKLRRKTGTDHGSLEKLTRAPVVAGGMLAVFVVAYVLWRRRGRPAKPDDPAAQKKKADARLEAIASLYRALDHALVAQGIARPPSTPPLRHAESLKKAEHPLAPEVLDLTNVYLEARFGGAALDEAARKSFEDRVRTLRQHKAPDTSAAAQ